MEIKSRKIQFKEPYPGILVGSSGSCREEKYRRLKSLLFGALFSPSAEMLPEHQPGCEEPAVPTARCDTRPRGCSRRAKLRPQVSHPPQPTQWVSEAPLQSRGWTETTSISLLSPALAERSPHHLRYPCRRWLPPSEPHKRVAPRAGGTFSSSHAERRLRSLLCHSFPPGRRKAPPYPTTVGQVSGARGQTPSGTTAHLVVL